MVNLISPQMGRPSGALTKKERKNNKLNEPLFLSFVAVTSLFIPVLGEPKFNILVQKKKKKVAESH